MERCRRVALGLSVSPSCANCAHRVTGRFCGQRGNNVTDPCEMWDVDYSFWRDLYRGEYARRCREELGIGERTGFTTYFANLRNLPVWITPISVCLHCPDWWDGKSVFKFGPTQAILSDWRRDHDEAAYEAAYREQILRRYTQKEVWKWLSNVAEGRPFALVCYEKPSDFCHRHLLADWLNKGGYEVKEFSKELLGRVKETQEKQEKEKEDD